MSVDRAGTRPIATTTLTRMRQCEVSVESGPDKGVTARLDDGALVVGSAPECDVVLHDETVSGRHCEIISRGDRVLVRDLGSRNGVLISGVRVVEAFLDANAMLQLGNTRLKLTSNDADVLVTQASVFGPLYGKSAAMRAVFAQLPAVAQSNAPVLLEGETGTGKDVTAEAIHQASGRADGPFVMFDCGAVASSLLEAELFGHEKNAFTGANAAREALAEAANGGTLVIDEVGELPLDLQPKLLRLVERQEIRRVGATATIPIDVRIIACTHRSLRTEAQAGRFREDLFFRLSALRLRLPALRERPDDIPGLVDSLLSARGSSLRFEQLPENDRALLSSHRWPGNVRELRNIAERLIAFPNAGAGSLLDAEGAPAPGGETTGTLEPLPLARQRAQDAFELQYVKEALLRAGNSVTEAAALAGVSRQFLLRLAKKHSLR